MENSNGYEDGRDTFDQQIETIYQVDWLVSSLNNIHELLDQVMRESEKAVNAEASCIALYDAEDGLLHIRFASGDASKEVRDLTVPLDQGILGEVASTCETRLVSNPALNPRFDPSVDQKTGFVTKSLLATPIKWHGKLLGVLEVIIKRNGSPFSKKDQRLLEIIANQAANAMGNGQRTVPVTQPG